MSTTVPADSPDPAGSRTPAPPTPSAPPAGVRVFLLDDHEVVRRGVQDLLDSEPDIEVVGEAATSAQALLRGPALRPDVAVLDVRLPDGDGITVCRELKSRVPGLACLMLTSFDDDDALLDAVMAGAAGYVLKQIKGSDLVAAVRTVASGASLLDPASKARLLAGLGRPGGPGGTGGPGAVRDSAAGDPVHPVMPGGLSAREHEVLALIGRGLTNRQIGKELFLSEKTVKNHISRLLAKLGVQRRIQAAVIASRYDPPGTDEGRARPT
ncbi:response regulator [Streptomyces sp. NPDC050504]|uniref:response regulator transcription factor n=1 Tax=Streptomyces sp. NPDC050504 TaxID=3365618 RepID=UPI0037AF14E7